MANLQHIAARVFRHVEDGHLPAAYSPTMGTLIDAYDNDPDFHEWADGVAGSTVEKLIATMVRQGKWDDPDWLREYVRRQAQRGAARPDSGLGWGMATFGAGAGLEQNGRRK